LDNILSDDNEILSRWKEFFEGLLNPIKATNNDTFEPIEPICFGEEEFFSAREVAAMGVSRGGRGHLDFYTCYRYSI